jgi:peptidoglycan hydrolase-like protein with peptidoglycan-binding domain
LGEPHTEARRLAKGDSGADVQLNQSMLKNAGYFKGICNGRFGSATERALKAFEKDHTLPINGVMSQLDYLELGLVE